MMAPKYSYVQTSVPYLFSKINLEKEIIRIRRYRRSIRRSRSAQHEPGASQFRLKGQFPCRPLGRRPPGQNDDGQDQRDLAPENFCAGHFHPSLRTDRSGGHFPIRKDFSRIVASRRTAGKKYLPGADRAFTMLDEDRGSRTIPGGSGGMESSANSDPNPDRTWIFWQCLPVCSNVPTLQSGDRT